MFVAAIGLLVLAGCQGKNTRTIENLKRGIVNESTSAVKYAAFANQARTESHDSIARLLDAISKSEQILAGVFQEILFKDYDIKVNEFDLKFAVGSTIENLQLALEIEKSEIKTNYPLFVDAAQKDQEEKVAKAFTLALEGEKKHLVKISRALESLNPDTTIVLPSGYTICRVCGNVEDNKQKQTACLLCGAKGKRFIKSN